MQPYDFGGNFIMQSALITPHDTKLDTNKIDTLQASAILSWGDETQYERRSMFIWNGGSGSVWKEENIYCPGQAYTP